MDLVTWLLGALIGAALLALLAAGLTAAGMGALLVVALVLLAGGTVFRVLAAVARWVNEQRLRRLEHAASAASLGRMEEAARSREGGQ